MNYGNYKIVKCGEKFYIRKGWVFHSCMDNTPKDSWAGNMYFGKWWSGSKQDFLERNCSFNSLEKAEGYWVEYSEWKKKAKAEKCEVVKHLNE
jgi:hypothetical protein